MSVLGGKCSNLNHLPMNQRISRLVLYQILYCPLGCDDLRHSLAISAPASLATPPTCSMILRVQTTRQILELLYQRDAWSKNGR